MPCHSPGTLRGEGRGSGSGHVAPGQRGGDVDANAPARPCRPAGGNLCARLRRDASRRGRAGRGSRPGDPAGRYDPGPRRVEPVQHRPRRRVRGLPADLPAAGRLRQGRQAGPRLRRQVGARSRPRHVGRRLLLVGPRAGRDQEGRQHRLRLHRPEHQGRGRHEGRVPGCQHVHRLYHGPVGPDLPGLHADPAQARLEQVHLQDDRRPEVRRPARGQRPVHARRVEDRPVCSVRPQSELRGPQGVRGRGRDPVLPRSDRRHGPGPQVG